MLGNGYKGSKKGQFPAKVTRWHNDPIKQKVREEDEEDSKEKKTEFEAANGRKRSSGSK